MLLAAVLSFSVSANTEVTPEALVKDTTDKVLEVLKKEKAQIDENPGLLYGIVDEYIIPHFDFRRMSQRVLGKYWHRASEEQQKNFVSQFQTLLVQTYGAALREYSDQKIEFLASRSRDGEVSVRTQIVQSGSPPIPIQYEMYKPDGEWKIYDVSIDGVSLVINYRSTFASEIRSSGVDGLIERLAEHNQRRR
jgi:phospholipid transport system substrate-binding protein